MPYYYGYDWTYVYLVLPCLIFSLWASWRVNGTFKKYSKQYSSRGLTGADAAQRVLRANGVSGVRIERIGGSLTDHYDPTSNVIRLSDDATRQAMRCSMPRAMPPSGCGRPSFR